MKIEKNDMENIVTLVETRVEQFMRDMEFIREKFYEWSKIYGEIEENSDWGKRLKKNWLSKKIFINQPHSVIKSIAK